MPNKFDSFASFQAHLDSRGLFRMNPGIGRIADVLKNMQLKRTPMPLVQVAGTNGKGSCCAFMASLAREHDLSCAVHSSPHFVSVRERLRIFRPGRSRSGDLLPESAWLEAANHVMRHGGEELTYFELVTAMAVYMLVQANVGLAVMESGLGGTFDATTALSADLTVFTPIALDHCNILGDSLTEIAQDKAGAMRPGAVAVSAAQSAEALAALKTAAAQKNTRLYFADESILPEAIRTGSLPLGLAGEHQKSNATLALAAWQKLLPLLDIPQNPQAESLGLARAWLPGRMQFEPPRPELALPALILDGGHNMHGLSALGHSLAKLGVSPGAVIFSCLEDKEPEKLIPHLRVISPGPFFVPQIQDHPRAMQAEKLASMIGLAATPVKNLAEAIKLARQSLSERLPEELDPVIQSVSGPGHPLLVCGSLYLLGEFYALYPQYLTKEEA